MRLRKLLKHSLDLQEVTIFDIDTQVEYYTNESVSYILHCDSTYDDARLGDMKVKEIFTDCRESEDVIYIGVKGG